jgi:hypothetical protein
VKTEKDQPEKGSWPGEDGCYLEFEWKASEKIELTVLLQLFEKLFPLLNHVFVLMVFPPAHGFQIFS